MLSDGQSVHFDYSIFARPVGEKHRSVGEMYLSYGYDNMKSNLMHPHTCILQSGERYDIVIMS